MVATMIQAWQLYENIKHVKFIDETMDSNQYQEHVMQMVEIALLCTQSPASKRPTMSEVVLMLPNGQYLGNRKPTKPTLIDHDRRIIMGSSNKAKTVANVSGIPKELPKNVEEYDKVDVMEKGMNVATVS